MKKIILTILFSSVLMSCVQTSNGVSNGLYTSWRDRDPISRVDNSVSDVKTGVSCAKNVLMLASFGDSSIEAAKEKGKIKKVAYVDREFDGFIFFYFPIFQKGCTVVHGE